MVTTSTANTSYQPVSSETWTMYEEGENVFSCDVVVCRDVPGYSAYAARLPGVCSQGDTRDEAIGNIHEALVGVLSEYIASGETIPWSDATIDGEVSFKTTILVKAGK